MNVSNLKPLDILSLNDSIDVKKQVSKAAHGLRSIDVSVNMVEDSENIRGGFVANQSQRKPRRNTVAMSDVNHKRKDRAIVTQPSSPKKQDSERLTIPLEHYLDQNKSNIMQNTEINV